MLIGLLALCRRGETPPILAHALKSGLGATRPSPASTPKRFSMSHKRGKSPASALSTPRSPAFEEYRQQVDTLTNQIRTQLSQVSPSRPALLCCGTFCVCVC